MVQNVSTARKTDAYRAVSLDGFFDKDKVDHQNQNLCGWIQTDEITNGQDKAGHPKLGHPSLGQPQYKNGNTSLCFNPLLDKNFEVDTIF